jgi:Flp pilus assembly protein TadB
MATTAITIEVDEEAARIFENASPDEQRKLAALVSLQLLEAVRSTSSLREVMDAIGQQAQQRGLTEERLQAILAEGDTSGTGERVP